MTIGTNANLEEKVKYFPFEVDFEQVLEALDQLEAWRLLGDSPGDVEEQVKELEGEVETLKEEVEKLEALVDDLQDDVAFHKTRIEELQDEVVDLQNEVADLKIELKEQL